MKKNTLKSILCLLLVFCMAGRDARRLCHHR